MSLLAASEFNTTFVVVSLIASTFLILLNGVYVAYEFAIIAAKRSEFDGENVQPTRANKAALKSLSDLSMQLAGAQLGITIASLTLGRVGEPAFESLIELALGSSVSSEVSHVIAFVVSLAVFTFLHLVIGEMVPKNIALSAPEATLRWLVIPYQIYLFIFRPFAQLLNMLANWGCRAVGIEPRDEIHTAHTATELAKLVDHSTQVGAIEQDDGALLKDVIEFSIAPVSRITKSLDDLATARVGVSAAHLERIFATSQQARVPIFTAVGTELVGYVHARDLLSIPPEGYRDPIPVGLIRQMAVVSAERSMVEVLRIMRRLRRQIAVVSNGAETLGVVSIEELTQQLVPSIKR